MKKISACLAIVFLVVACSWRSPNSEFYVMNRGDLQAISNKKISVAVAKVKVPDMLDRAQMVVSDEGSNQIRILEFQRWGDVYPDILQNAVTNDLIAYLPNAYVKRTYFDGENVMYSVNIEVNQLMAYPGYKVVLSAWWNIKDAKGNIIRREQGSYEAKVEGNEIKDLVVAQSKAVHQMSQEIAAALVK